MQYSNNVDSKYGYNQNQSISNYNSNMNNSNYYGMSNQMKQTYPSMDKAYSMVTTEPVVIDCSLPLVIVDPPLEPHVKSYTTWSIFNIFCCCFIGGFVTTFLAFRVRMLNDTGNFKEALKLSSKVLLANLIITMVGAITYLIAFPYAYMAIYPSLPKINW